MKRRTLYGLFSVLMVVGLVLAACAPATPAPPAEEPTEAPMEEPTEEPMEEPTEEPMEEGPVTIVVGTTDSISSLDFADAYAIHDWELFRNVNRGLMSFEPGTADVVPRVAASPPEISEDGLTYTFTIEDGWTYPDGTELVAGDFVRGINRSLTLEGDVAGLVTSYVESVEAPDDSTVVFHLTSPRGDFPQIVTGAAYMPVQEGQYPEEELTEFPDTVTGVGPWQITEYSVEEQAVLEHNPNFKEGFPENAPDRIIVRYFQDATQMALAVENGEIDIAWRILGPPEVQRLSEVGGLGVHNSGGGGIRYLVPNHSVDPFMGKLERQALAYLLDRDEIADRVMQGTVDPLYSQVPPGFIGSNEAFLDMYGAGADVAAAEELLTEAGYTEDSPLSFDLWYPPEHYGTHAAQIFQVLEEQFEATPLVDVTLQSQEWGTYVGAITGGEYPIGYLGWFFDYPDSSNYLDPFAKTGFSDGLGVFYSNEEMDTLLDEAAASTDEAERADLYEQAQNLYAEDVVTLPIVFEPEFAVFNTETVADVIIGPALFFQYELIELAP